MRVPFAFGYGFKSKDFTSISRWLVADTGKGSNGLGRTRACVDGRRYNGAIAVTASECIANAAAELRV